jgi:hypothetical protein
VEAGAAGGSAMSEWQEEIRLRDTKMPWVARILFGVGFAIYIPLSLMIIIESWKLLFKTLGL